MIEVLSVTSECVPLVKTGGLADVAGALPGALAGEGVHMRTLIPGYPTILSAVRNARSVLEVEGCFGGAARVLSVSHAGLDLLILDAPHLFVREGGIYLDKSGKDWPDNPERFAALSHVAAEIADGALDDWVPDVVHCHDWQAGLTPYFMSKSGAKAASILTIHNIAFQGIAPAKLGARLRVAASDLTPDKVEYFGNISALKAGLIYADKLTTVSPTYAEELLTPEFGMGMEGVLTDRRRDLIGILNGIDESTWSPEVDPNINQYKTARGKAPNKKKLRKEFGLPDAQGPLCVVISRLSEQKGLDLLLQALPALIDRGGQLALLGAGDAELEKAFRAFEHPHVSVQFGYDEPKSHRMVAGADAILVPSRFEPCGLTQLYGLRYGTLPLVALTGGLADTVIPATPATMAKQVATGLQFYPVTAHALAGALTRLCDLFEQPAVWAKMQRNAMSHPVSWQNSAAQYAALYRNLVQESR